MPRRLPTTKKMLASHRNRLHVQEDTEDTASDDIVYPGALLDAKYVVLRYIGRGEYARIWHVYDVAGQQSRAAKIWITKRSAIDEADCELDVLAKLGDLESGCVRMYDHFTLADGQRKVAIIQLSGDYVKGRMPTVDDAERAFTSVGKALHAAHTRRGVVHADIKPENILFATAYSKEDTAGRWFFEHIMANEPLSRWVDAQTADIEDRNKRKMAKRKKRAHRCKQLAEAYRLRRGDLPEPDDVLDYDACLLIDFRGLEGSHLPDWAYVSPEGIIDEENTPEGDWWSLAAVACYWATGRRDFRPRTNRGESDRTDRDTLACIVSRVKEKVPVNWARQSHRFADLFDRKGKVRKCTRAPSFEDQPLVEGGEAFVRWVTDILHIDPRSRKLPDFCADASGHQPTSVNLE